jgi:pyruvate dehydrogenase E1 component alpha subunit/2-oxoisovalerate dehydrogenase E1 component alpha subunit
MSFISTARTNVSLSRAEIPLYGQHRVSAKLLVEAYKLAMTARLLDEKIAALYRSGKIAGSVYLGKGHEAVSVSIGLHLRHGDVFAPTIRDAAGRLAFGETIGEALRGWLGSSLGPMRGREGNIHRGRPADGYLPMISHLGAMVAVVNGALLAKRLKGICGSVGAVSVGEGATSTGAFHEGINQAAVERLPIVIVITNNQFAYSTPKERQFACKSLLDRAAGYGVRGWSVDGTDLDQCIQTIGEAIQTAREGRGPQLVVAELLRLCGHGEHDDASYIPIELKESLVGRDCLTVAEAVILRRSLTDQATLNGWKHSMRREIDRIVAEVCSEPSPDGSTERWRAYATQSV